MEKVMKKEKRFIITEIYQDDMHAVDKVLVDTMTNVQYLLHQEGSGCSCTPLLGPDGFPLLSSNPVPHPDSLPKVKEEIPEEDLIHEREHDEPIETIKPVRIKKRRKKHGK